MPDPSGNDFDFCETCGDSGYEEVYRGAVWVRGPMTSVITYCSCIVGQYLEIEKTEAASNA